MRIEPLVDAFVERVNRQPHEPMSLNEVPDVVRKGVPDVFTDWMIVKADNSASIHNLESRLGRRFPPSFAYLLSNYCFPAFEFGPIMLFANTGHKNPWELSERLFADPYMSPVLLQGGFIQIGNPYFYNYDPVCFDSHAKKSEYPIVTLDHEEILQFGRLTVVRSVARSFVDFLVKHADR